MLTFFTLFLVVSAAIGAHRLYNYEDIFEPIRRLVGNRSFLKPIWCPKCNAFWAGVGAVSVQFFTPDPWKTMALAALAAYPWVRGMVWLYAYGTRVVSAVPTLPIDAAASKEVDAVMAKIHDAIPKQILVPAKPACGSCDAAKKMKEALKEEQKKNFTFKRRVVLMTPMISDWSPSYSVAAVILDQARMLAADETSLVQIWVTTTCNMNGVPELPKNVEIKKVLPPIPLVADYVDDKAKELFFGQVLQHMLVLGNATIIAHDLLFVSSYLTVAAAIHEKLGPVNGFKWFHFCHSAPSAIRPTDPKVLYRASLPEGHRLLCLADAQVEALAIYYGTTRDRIDVVPNARDIRLLTNTSPRISQFISAHKLLDADIVQVFPLSTPRAGAKGLSQVIKIFAALARTHMVRLVVVNAHANQNQETVLSFVKEAKAAGLPDGALVFTSLAMPDLAVYGLPAADVQALFQVSNLFVFPTASEACSMTLMEAAANGCHLVLNASVPSLFDIMPLGSYRAYRWGSVTDLVSPSDQPNPGDVAEQIINDLDASLANRSKRAVLRSHNVDAVGARLRSVVTANPPT